MIAHLHGQLISKKATQSIVECNGVGYEVFHTSSTAERMQSSEVRLFIYTHVREESFSLYGFLTEDEKDLFIELLRINSVGPKLALSILSGLPHHEFLQAINEKDITRLQKIPGIGKKTAERMALELYDRLKTKLSNPASTATPVIHSKASELQSLLTNLGYQRSDVDKAIRKLEPKIQSEAIESLVKEALGELSP